jgi:hypothetical protein
MRHWACMKFGLSSNADAPDKCWMTAVLCSLDYEFLFFVIAGNKCSIQLYFVLLII